MLLGRSVFHSVLDRLKTEADEREETAQPAHRISGLNMSFAAATAETTGARLRRLELAYFDILADGHEAAASDNVESEPVMPPHLAVLEVAAIAAELAITPGTTIAELSEKRRLFARANHPDCVHEAFRGNATVRMTIANQLIDMALRQR